MVGVQTKHPDPARVLPIKTPPALESAGSTALPSNELADDPEPGWSFLDIRVRPVYPEEPWGPTVWSPILQKILHTHDLLTAAMRQADREINLLPFSIDKFYYDNAAGCGVIRVHVGSSAEALRDLLVDHIDMDVRLLISVKTDVFLYVTRGFLPKNKQLDVPKDVETQLKRFNPFLAQAHFKLIRTEMLDKGTAYLFEVGPEVIRWIKKRDYRVQALSAQVEFSYKNWFIKISRSLPQDPVDPPPPPEDVTPTAIPTKEYVGVPVGPKRDIPPLDATNKQTEMETKEKVII